MTWHPLPSAGSRWLRFPGFIGTTRCSDVPTVPPAALRCLRLAVPRLHSCFVPVAVECAGAGLELISRYPTGHYRGGRRTSQVPGEPLRPYALFFDPGRTAHTRPLRCVGMAPAMSTAKAPTKFQLSRLNRTALGLAVYASPGAVTRTRRKTRFRPLAKRYRTGLITRRVPMKGFRIASYASSSFPKLYLAQGHSGFFFRGAVKPSVAARAPTGGARHAAFSVIVELRTGPTNQVPAPVSANPVCSALALTSLNQFSRLLTRAALVRPVR